MKREILFYGKFFPEFYSRQEIKTQRKIDYVLDLIRNVDRIPVRFFKYLEDTDGLYEIKIPVVSGNLRIFSFFD